MPEEELADPLRIALGLPAAAGWDDAALVLARLAHARVDPSEQTLRILVEMLAALQELHLTDPDAPCDQAEVAHNATTCGAHAVGEEAVRACIEEQGYSFLSEAVPVAIVQRVCPHLAMLGALNIIGLRAELLWDGEERRVVEWEDLPPRGVPFP